MESGTDYYCQSCGGQLVKILEEHLPNPVWICFSCFNSLLLDTKEKKAELDLLFETTDDKNKH